MNWLEAHLATTILAGAIIIALSAAVSILVSAQLARDQYARLRRDENRREVERAASNQSRAVALVTLAEARLRRLAELLLTAGGTSLVLSGRARALLQIHERALTRFAFDDLVGAERLAAFEEAVGLTLAAGNQVDEARSAMEEALAGSYSSSEKARLLYVATADCAKKMAGYAAAVADRGRRLER